MASKNTEIQDVVIRLKAYHDIQFAMTLLIASMTTTRQLLMYGLEGRDAGDDFDCEIYCKELTDELDKFVTERLEKFF